MGRQHIFELVDLNHASLISISSDINRFHVLIGQIGKFGYLRIQIRQFMILGYNRSIQFFDNFHRLFLIRGKSLQNPMPFFFQHG